MDLQDICIYKKKKNSYPNLSFSCSSHLIPCISTSSLFSLADWSEPLFIRFGWFGSFVITGGQSQHIGEMSLQDVSRGMFLLQKS